MRHRPQETQKLRHPLKNFLSGGDIPLCVADFRLKIDAETALHRLVVNSELCPEPLLHIEEFEIVEV
jgi:hypothetical protein